MKRFARGVNPSTFQNNREDNKHVSKTQGTIIKRFYRCQEAGHLANTCKQQRQSTYFGCNQPRHRIAEENGGEERGC